jgi:hypothetical protein
VFRQVRLSGGDRARIHPAASLSSGEVNEVSLDHDLGDAAAGTGYDVACFIEARAFDGTLPRIAWQVHSANPVGADRMVLALRQADAFWDRQPNRNRR